MFNARIGPLELIIVLVIVLVSSARSACRASAVSSGAGCASSRSRSRATTTRRRRRARAAATADAARDARQATDRRGRRRGEPLRGQPLAQLAVRWRTALRPIGHEDRLSLVDHLDELRSRLIICGATLVVAFAVCFWQNGALLDIAEQAARDARRRTRSTAAAAASPPSAARRPSSAGSRSTSAGTTSRSRRATRSSPADASRASTARWPRDKQREADVLPAHRAERRPVTTGRRRAVHGHAHDRLLLRAAALAADAALPGLRVRAAGLLARRSARSRCR